MINIENEQPITKLQLPDKLSMDEILKKVADAPQIDREHLIAVANGMSTEKFYDPDGEI